MSADYSEDRQQRMTGEDLTFEIMRLTNALEDAYQRERNTRIALLRLHSLLGLAVGVLVFFGGTAGLVEHDFGLWIRPVMGGLAFGSGAVLLLGLHRPNGRFTLEIVGLAMMGLWDFLMAIVITGLCFSYNRPWVFPLPHNAEIPLLQPRPYAILVYLALALMVWGVHLRAVLRDRRGRV